MKNRFHILIAVVLLTVACARRDAAVEDPTGKPQTVPQVATTNSPEEPRVPGDGCRAALGEFLNALIHLDSLLSAGLEFGAYSQQVGEIRVKFDQVETARVRPRCLSAVALPAQSALHRYVEAYNIWNNCMGDSACSEDQVMPQLETKWAEATSHIGQAETGLEALSGG